MKKVLIIGASGQISRYLIERLQDETDWQLTLFSSKAHQSDDPQVKWVQGSALDQDQLNQVIAGQDVIYMNFDDQAITKKVLQAMTKNYVGRLIQAGVLNVYGEVAEPFASWNAQMLGPGPATGRGNEVLEASDIDYVYLRLAWLYNGPNRSYVASPKGEPFVGAQISREAVSQYILDNLTGKRADHRASLGLWEPGTEYWSKPSFY